MEYYIKTENKMEKVSPKNYEYAKKIDKNANGILEYNEIRDFLIKNDDFKIINTRKGSEILYEKEVIKDFQDFLADKLEDKKDFIRDYEKIVNSMKELAAKYPDKVSLEVIGKTFEGRDLIVMKINTNKDNPNKKSLLVTGLHHAREWATGESAINIAEKLLQDYPDNEEVKNLLDNTDLYIFPVVNPDGYEYSLKKSAWWRKNRKVFEKGVGVDLNRNYYTEKNPELYRPRDDKPDSTWDDYGASDSVYSDTYRGPYGASEEEVRAIQEFVNKNNIQTVIDIHSYGNMILFPWGHTTQPTEWDNIYKEVGNEMNKVVGNKYWVSQSIYLYPATGTSEDYHHEEGRFNYTLEIGRSFFPSSKKELEQLKSEVLEMTKVFMKNLVSGKIPVKTYEVKV
ncbi:MAG: M14 family metallopeptidase [bacterium]